MPELDQPARRAGRNQITNRKQRLPLNLQVEVEGVDIYGDPFREVTQSINVSGGGICFESRRELLVGRRVLLYVQLPFKLRKYFRGRSEYRVRAVICRVEPMTVERISRVGARFLQEVEA